MRLSLFFCLSRAINPGPPKYCTLPIGAQVGDLTIKTPPSSTVFKTPPSILFMTHPPPTPGEESPKQRFGPKNVCKKKNVAAYGSIKYTVFLKALLFYSAVLVQERSIYLKTLSILLLPLQRVENELKTAKTKTNCPNKNFKGASPAAQGHACVVYRWSPLRPNCWTH